MNFLSISLNFTTFPFNILGNRLKIITFKNLSDRTKATHRRNIHYKRILLIDAYNLYFIFILLKIDPKNSFSCVSNKNIVEQANYYNF